jgi:hypothetical protein
MRITFLLLLSTLFVANCQPPTPQPDNSLDGHWVFPLSIITAGKVTPNALMTLDKGNLHVEIIGTGELVVDDTYGILEKKLYVGNQSTPYLELVERAPHQLKVVLIEKDTVVLQKVVPAASSKTLKERLLGRSFSMYASGNLQEQQVYFAENELLIFGRDVVVPPERSFPTFSFNRLPYTVSLATAVPSIIIGDPTQSFYKTLPDGHKVKGNLIIGLLQTADNQKLSIELFLPHKNDVVTLHPLHPKDEQHPLIAKKWHLGSLKTFNFDPSGTLLIKGKDEVETQSWALDDSGKLIIMTDQQGHKQYAIKNFNSSDQRIGYEFRRGTFTDLIGREE